MVIMGHDHKRAQNQFGNIKYITLDALADYNKNPSYLKLKFSRSDLTHVFIEIK